ncbi:MAG: PAS domain-containing protein, partial [Bacillota bacterium]
MSKNKGSGNERLLQKIDRFLFGESRHSRIKPVYTEKTMEELYAENEELKKANNRSNSLQKKYLTLFNSAPIAYFIFDTEFTIIQANQTAARLFRMEKFRFAGLPFNTLADKESHDILSSFQGRILSRKSRERCELKMKSKDGKEFYAMLESVPVIDESNDIIQILSILSDVTEYKHAEIAKRKQHLQTAINNVIDPFAVLRPIKDESGNIIDFVCEFINEAGLKTTKLSRKENKGKRILSIYPYFMESGLFYDAVRVLETGTALIREPLKAKCPAAGLKLYTSAINKLDDSVIITWRDITEKRRMEEALKESNEKYKSMFENIPIGA